MQKEIYPKGLKFKSNLIKVLGSIVQPLKAYDCKSLI